jgi:peptide/nickel transport system permease protein
MQAYILKRILLFIPTMLIVTTTVFIILRLVPGDPAQIILSGTDGRSQYSDDQVESLQAKLGTDKPLVQQYAIWTWNMLHLDFGTSFWYETPVWEDIKTRFPITLQLTIMALLIASIIAVPLGAISAVYQDSPLDYASRLVTIMGIALPNFWVAVMVLFILSNEFDQILAPLGYVQFWKGPTDNLHQLVFPAFALALSNMAFVARITRSAVLEVFREDYIRTARSKGLSEGLVIRRHALKNALLPVVTVSAYEFGRLMGGTVIIERIFNVPGMGWLLISAISQRDFPMIQAIVVVLTGIVLVLNVLTDLIYAWLNPRIRYA